MTNSPFKSYEEAKEIYDLCNYEIDTRAEINSTAMEQSKESIKLALMIAGVAIAILFLVFLIPFEKIKMVLGAIVIIAFCIAYYGHVMYNTILKPLGGLSALSVLWPDTSGIPDGVKDAVSSVSAGVMAYVLESVPGGILVVLLFKPIIFMFMLEIAVAFPPFVAILHIRRNNKELDYFHQIKGLAKQAMQQFESGQAPAGAISQGEMRCPNCSRLLKPGQSFCTKCGTRL